MQNPLLRTLVWPPMESTLPRQATMAWPAVGGIGGIGAGGGLSGVDEGGGAAALAPPASTGAHSSFSRSRSQVSAKYRPPAAADPTSRCCFALHHADVIASLQVASVLVVQLRRTTLHVEM